MCFTEIFQKCLEKFLFVKNPGNFLELFLVIIKPSWSTFVPVSPVCAGHGD